MLIWFAFIVFSVLDIAAYTLAPYSERSRWFYRLPGGGFVALCKKSKIGPEKVSKGKRW